MFDLQRTSSKETIKGDSVLIVCVQSMKRGYGLQNFYVPSVIKGIQLNFVPLAILEMF